MNTIRVSNRLDLDHFVRPDLGPNCLHKLSADDTSRQRVNTVSCRLTSVKAVGKDVKQNYTPNESEFISV